MWAVLAGTAFPAAAHDFWIEPSTYRPRVGQAVSIGLRVGDHFKGQPVVRTPDRIVKFVSVRLGGESPIPGRAGTDPAGLVRFTAPGTHVLGYRGNRAFTEMEADGFKKYLEEKGLETILARRAELGQTDRKVREAYSRCSKSLIRVGDAAGGGGDRPIGFTLEILAESDPYEKAAGSDLSFRLAYEGRPLPGALVTATRQGARDEPLSARTDAGGRVRFTLGEAGSWLIACVHMIEAPEGVDAEWESLWASLTFELPAAPAAMTKDAGP